MSKISCIAARKHDLSGGFANVWDGVLNSYKPRQEGFHMDEQKKQKRKNIMEWVAYFLILATVFVTFHFILMLGRIPSESMEPTLMVHDWTLGNRLAYNGDGKPERGDIIIFDQEEEGTLIKRVIGLPGETVSFVAGKVYIDGNPLDESAYLDDSVVTECDETFTVPEDSYFMLGDNREVSLDARYWENPYISEEDIKCKVLCVIPFHKLPWF